MCTAAEMMPKCFSDESVNCSLPPSERLVSSTLERERGGSGERERGGGRAKVTTCTCVECRGFESHPRQLIFLRKSDCLGCAVLLCLVVCLTLLASSFLLSSLINTCTLYYTHLSKCRLLECVLVAFPGLTVVIE